MAGYSGTPLPKKLGIKPGHRVALLRAPAGFALDPLPEGVTLVTTARAGPYDVIVRAEADSVDDLGRLVVARIQAIEGITRTLTCPVVHL